MNEQNDLERPEAPSPNPPKLQPAPARHTDSGCTLADWTKRLLACNPFYLLSAALLLYGVYRLSADRNFLSRETAQLVFNFSSIQIYELLLVSTAILLARRLIWYDSSLLFVIENLFLVVPFLLVSQAALINETTVWILCGLTAALLIARAAAVQKWIPRLRIPPRLLDIGFVLITVNAILPALYRVLHASKIGTKPTWGLAYDTNEWIWIGLVPILCALAHVLPRRRADGELPAERRWFPISLFLLWLTATGVHLYSLGYIYDFSLQRVMVAPALWVLAWTLFRRRTDFLETPPEMINVVGLILPLMAAILPGNPGGNVVFLLLNAANVFLYTWLAVTGKQRRAAGQFIMASLALIIAGAPYRWAFPHLPELSGAEFTGIAGLAYLILAAAFSANPKVATFGSIAMAFAAATAWGERGNTVHIAAQAALIFLLLHSLRWRDDLYPGAVALRVLTGALWVFDSFFWLRAGVPVWLPSVLALSVIAAYAVTSLIRGKWLVPVAPVAAFLVLLSSPAGVASDKMRTTPAGLIFIGVSLVLFAAGTALALTKHRWNREKTEHALRP